MAEPLPECFCKENGLDKCDWKVEISGRYYRCDADGNPIPGSINAMADYHLGGIPQPIAQATLQAAAASINQNGANIYAAWLEQCYGEDAEITKAAKLVAALL